MTLGREIGIDIERVRIAFASEGIAERSFSRHEIAALRTLHGPSRVKAFFRCWTRKEAYVKATGEGLAIPLEEFDVSLLPGEPAALLARRGDAGEASRWALEELEANSEYVAAIAVEGHGWRLRRWRWPDA